MTPKIVFLNSPPRTGKDTLANHLPHELNVGLHSYGDFPKRGTHASFGMFNITPRHFEDTKDTPNELFFGMTPRQAYIQHAEEYMKLRFGRDVYGKLMARHLKHIKALHVVISDLGFKEEVEELIPLFGVENMLILHIHRLGFTYERVNDSRTYIEIPGVASAEVRNVEGSTTHLKNEGLAIVKNFMKS